MSQAITPSNPGTSPLGALAQLTGNAPWPVPNDATANATRADEAAEPDQGIKEVLTRWAEMPNIADDPDIADEELSALAQRVSRDYEIDENSRSDWKTKYQQWIDFAMQVAEEKTYPWPQASNIIYPLITAAAIQFHARAYPAIIRDRNVVKGTVIGSDDGEPDIDPQTGQPAMQPGPDGQPQPVWKVAPGAKKLRADQIGEHMSWQLLDEQEEWEPQTDKLLIVVPIVGCMFRKSYFDPGMQRNVSETVNALDLCVNYKAKSFEAAPRATEIVRLYPWEVEENIRSGIFLDAEYGHDTDGEDEQDEDATVTFLEQHRRYDLDRDGYPEPYIVTISRDGQKLARIVAAYEVEGIHFAKDGQVRKIEQVSYYTKIGFIPSPDSGVYDIGFGHLLYPINAGINSSLNQMFDAGHLQNAGGGFIGTQLSMNTGAVRFQVGEYKPVNTNGGNIRDNVFPIPFPGPSQVLFSLMQFLVEAGKEIAAVKDIMVGDMPGDNTSGITTLAVIEQGLKVFSAIYKRIHRSLKSEFKKLYRLNRRYLPLTTGYQVGNTWKQISRADYEKGAGVEPVSDPQMMTDMQRLGRAQFLGQFKDDPHFDQVEIRRRMLDAAQIPGADTLLVTQKAPDPALAVQTAQLALAHEELNIRAAHQEAELDLKRGSEKAKQLDLLTHAILNLANAQKADHAANQAWYALKLQGLQAQVEALDAAGNDNPVQNSPAAAADGTPGAAGNPGAPAAGAAGALPPAVPAMAPPSGQPGVPPVPGGLPQAG